MMVKTLREINEVARKISVTPPQGAENFVVNK